jgi:hypothetical protein
MTGWTDFVTNLYNSKKHIKGYSYKSALKEAGPMYRKGNSTQKFKKQNNPRGKSRKNRSRRRR